MCLNYYLVPVEGYSLIAESSYANKYFKSESVFSFLNNLCWFANLFSNVLILQAFSKKRYQKQVFKLYPRYF